MDGKSVELLDTPGFDDSDQDDGRTFIDFAQLLGSSSRTDKLLNGVIYMEPVEGPRVGDSERKRLDLIKNILGAQFMDRTAIVTSTWDLGITAKRQVWEDGRVQSEAVWGGMLGPGKATLIHFENTQESATEIIRHFLDSEKFSPCPVLLQTELARNGEKLSDTSAGRLLHVIVSEEVETIKQQISFTGGTKKLEEAVQQKQSFLKRLAEVVVGSATDSRPSSLLISADPSHQGSLVRCEQVHHRHRRRIIVG